MSATSLKLSDELKRRIARLAASSGQTPHAFMVDALAREAERSELRQRFAAEAADSEREALGSGKAHSLGATFDHEEGRRELVLSRGKYGHMAKCRWLPAEDVVLILAVRHQREAGYTEDQ